MKYTEKNKPYICMQNQSSCYKNTGKMTVKGILWHSTAANNPYIKRYVQPSSPADKRDTVTLAQLGKNAYGNDWNHIKLDVGMNAFIGKLADGTVTSIQCMPWDFKPWGCGSGRNGSCNNGWIQFEICEDNLADRTYFEKVYKEACELTAYICKLYGIDPKGTVNYNGVKVPTILCHQDSYKLGLGSKHSDIYHWFPKHGKDMNTVRNDVAALLSENGTATPPKTVAPVKTYTVSTDINKYSSAADAQNKKNSKGTIKKGIYYIFNKYPDGYKGMYNITTDKAGLTAGSWINPAENVFTPAQMYRVRKSKDDAKSQIGAYSVLENAKIACDKASEGYKVFDSDFNVVYEYKKGSPGDVDGDGKTTASDSRAVLRQAVGLDKHTPEGDVNGDGKISAEDARSILRMATGLE